MFNEDQRGTLQDMAKDIKALKSKIKGEDTIFELPERDAKDQKNFKTFRHVWRNNGYIPGANDQVAIKDLLKKDVEVTRIMKDNFSTDHPLLIPRVVSEMAREAIEPALVLTPLMNRINYSAGTSITFPAFGAFHAADLDEGEEYPERSLETAGQTTATIGKSGVAIKITEEALRYNQYDLISLYVRQAGRALARLKERKVADLITADYGNIIFDNNSTAYRTTTGRDADGAYNGTLTLDDLFEAYAVMVNRGYTPNALIMHPFAWRIFAEEGIARAFGFINGMNPLMWQLPQGSPGSAPNWRQGGLNQNTYVSSPSDIATTFTNVPSIFPTNFRIIVSPYMPFTASTNLTDIVFCDVNELGLLVVDEEVTSDEWNDPARDIMKMKFRERYALAVQNDGKGIGLMKNIKIAKSFDMADRLKVNIEASTLSPTLTGDAHNYRDLNL